MIINHIDIKKEIFVFFIFRIERGTFAVKLKNITRIIWKLHTLNTLG